MTRGDTGKVRKRKSGELGREGSRSPEQQGLVQKEEGAERSIELGAGQASAWE